MGQSLKTISDNLECEFIANLLGLSATALSDTMDEFIALGIVRKNRDTDRVSVDCWRLHSLSEPIDTMATAQPSADDFASGPLASI